MTHLAVEPYLTQKASEKEWQSAVRASDVRLQWDPDHSPHGEKLERRAIQLGLRGDALMRYGKTDLLDVTDISELVAEQRDILSRGGVDAIQTPTEHVFLPRSPDVATRLGLAVEDVEG